MLRRPSPFRGRALGNRLMLRRPWLFKVQLRSLDKRLMLRRPAWFRVQGVHWTKAYAAQAVAV